MTDKNVKYEEPNNADESYEEDSDRISIVQWILLFVVLGVVVYVSPILFKLLPK